MQRAPQSARSPAPSSGRAEDLQPCDDVCRAAANAFHALARFLRPGAARDAVLAQTPAEWKTGPILAEAAYPDVLVARAVSDGKALDLVLRPGNGAGRTTLAIERLHPRHTYRLTGAVNDAVSASDEGRALIEVDLADRLTVRVEPQA